jgi:DsbE subfamily thiol:disulfide oxidoreductase
MRRWIFVLPVLGFLVVAGFLFKSLFLTPTQVELPSVLIDKPAPAFALSPLDEGEKGFVRTDLASGRVTVVNFFASWCAPCRLEADSLMLLSRSRGVTLFGVAYKDKPADTRRFLTETGNPFAAILADREGAMAIDWGVTAAPETFVIDGKGVIRFKYVGPLSADILARVLMPEIRKAEAG